MSRLITMVKKTATHLSYRFLYRVVHEDEEQLELDLDFIKVILVCIYAAAEITLILALREH